MDDRSASRTLLTLVQGAAFALLTLYAAHVALGLGGHGLDGVANDFASNALLAFAAGSCLVRAARFERDRYAWLWLGLGIAAFLAGDLYWTVALAERPDPPFPSFADLGYLLLYPASYAALVMLVRGRVRRFHASLWLDGLIGALAVAAGAAALIFDAVLTGTGGEPAAIAVNLAYPLGDLLLLTIVVGVMALTGWRPGRAWALLGIGLAGLAIADSLYVYQVAMGSYVEGTALDAVWPAAAMTLQLAAWCRPAPHARVRLDGLRVLVVPLAGAAAGVSLLVYGGVRHLNVIALALASATVLVVVARAGLTFRENLELLTTSRREALSDVLTGLRNRRALTEDLEDVFAGGVPAPRVLALFDLNGFKAYNDAFGHPAGDELLRRLGARLAAAVADSGRAYRMGGDEFCVLLDAASIRSAGPLLAAASAALHERGEAFTIDSSYGAVAMPVDAGDPTAALNIADRRMYAGKDSRRASARRQSADVLLQALRAREPDLDAHVREVGALCAAVGRRLGLDVEQLDELQRAAELHDIGKLAIPEAILAKPGPLDEEEWRFMRRHTIIGEEILAAAPALAPVARLVRSSHERWDGGGYPDGLAGEAIPLGARIIAVCDSYQAMTADRVYRAALSVDEALAELRRCAGAQFDPAVVAAFVAAVPAVEPTAAAVASH